MKASPPLRSGGGFGRGRAGGEGGDELGREAHSGPSRKPKTREARSGPASHQSQTFRSLDLRVNRFTRTNRFDRASRALEEPPRVRFFTLSMLALSSTSHRL